MSEYRGMVVNSPAMLMIYLTGIKRKQLKKIARKYKVNVDDNMSDATMSARIVEALQQKPNERNAIIQSIGRHPRPGKSAENSTWMKNTLTVMEVEQLRHVYKELYGVKTAPREKRVLIPAIEEWIGIMTHQCGDHKGDISNMCHEHLDDLIRQALIL